MIIIQGGQTGVDRGAWRGAGDMGLARGGWMPASQHDELGLIPGEVSHNLRPALNGGENRSRTIANVVDADAVLIIHPPGRMSPGTSLTWLQAGANGKPWIVIDGSPRRLNHVEPWLREVHGRFLNSTDAAIRMFRLMVAGPRASKWSDGFDVARRAMHIVGAVYGTKPNQAPRLAS